MLSRRHFRVSFSLCPRRLLSYANPARAGRNIGVVAGACY
jgi:hypothetical protein